MGLKNQQQLCDAKAHIGADGITEETYGDTWTDDGLVAQGASHDRCEGRRADERYAGGDRRICIDAEDGTQQYVEQQRAEGGLQFVTPFFLNSPNCLYLKKSREFLQRYKKTMNKVIKKPKI